MRKESKRMLSLVAAGMFALCLPAAAAAQWSGYPETRAYGRYSDRDVRDAVHRLDSLAKSFERNLDRALDRSRMNGTQREDRINAQAHDFRRAVGDLRSHVGNGRDLYRSQGEAELVLREADQLNRIARPGWYDGTLASEWSQIQSELRVINDAYGLRYNGGRSNDNPRNNRNDDWRRRIPFPR